MVLAGAFASAGVGPASASAASGFQDQSKNIQCAVKGSAVTCIIKRQDKAKCAALFTASGALKSSGPSVMNFGCFATAPFSDKKFTTLKYGKKKTLKGVTCTMSKTAGVKCTNGAKHGFTLSRKGSTSF